MTHFNLLILLQNWANAFAEKFGFHFNLQFCDSDFPVGRMVFIVNWDCFFSFTSFPLYLIHRSNPKDLWNLPWNTESYYLFGSFRMTSRLEESNIDWFICTQRHHQTSFLYLPHMPAWIPVCNRGLGLSLE